MNTSELGQKYFNEVLNERFSTDRLKEISQEIKENGVWEEEHEWRISTYIMLRIEPFNDENGEQWYRASVKNGVEASCVCPTLTRALQYLVVLEKTTMDMFLGLGWSSWAEKGRLKATPNET